MENSREWTRRVFILLGAAVLFGVIFAGTVDAGINSWSPIGPGGGTVRVLAIDPSAPSTIYAGTYGGGVFRSTDGGPTWGPINTGLSNLYVFALAIDPSAPSTLYAGTDGEGVFKSTNGGTSWSGTGLTNQSVLALAIDPS